MADPTKVLVQRDRPTINVDNVSTGVSARGGMYGETLVNLGLPSWQQLADEGSIYVASNATPGTGLQSALITGYSATADGDTVIVNGNSAASKRRIYPLYIKKMMSGTAPATTTVQHFALFTDVTSGCTPSAGSVALAPKQVNTGASSGPSSALIYVPTGTAAMTIPTATGARTLVGRTSIPTSLGITGDVYTLLFGPSDGGGQGGGTAVRATAPANLTASTAPVVLDPGYGLIVDFWWLTATTTAPTWEWEILYIER